VPPLPPPLVRLPVQGLVPAIPPPPAGAFARPIPPGGATVRVYEEKREEEGATEQSQAFAAYRADGDRSLTLGARAYVSAHGGGGGSGPLSPAVYLLIAAVAAAAAGASLRVDPRRRSRRSKTAFATVRNQQPPLPSPRPYRRRP
jgi:hypothetical protein